MKLAISGKGGVGKTTFTALVCRMLANTGKKVLAIDADPDSNLAKAIGISQDEIEKATPITEMTKLIEERTGAKPGASGGFFKLNPKVDDIPDKYSLNFPNIRVLVLGRYKKGGTGCYCSENVMIKSLINHLILKREEVLIIDMEAGIEHLSRGTASAVDAMIAIVEPGMRSIETANTIKLLVSDLGIKHYFVIANKIRNDEDREFIDNALNQNEILGYIQYSEEIIYADQNSQTPYNNDSYIAMNEISHIIEKLNQKIRV